jgi:hypothetical protein
MIDPKYNDPKDDMNVAVDAVMKHMIRSFCDGGELINHGGDSHRVFGFHDLKRALHRASYHLSEP